MNCLKKAICFLVLPAVLLSCMPESVQAVTVIPKSEHTVPEEHGESIFDNENTLSVTCNSNRVVYNSDKLGYSIYAEDTFDYCAVRSDGIERCRNERSAIYLFMVSDEEIPFYEVRDGLYCNGYNQSRTFPSPHKIKGSDGKTYYCYLTDMTTNINEFWYGAPEAPEVRPVYMPPVITVPKDVTTEADLEKRVLEYLITGDFSDCHVSAGDADNPSANKPGGLPGSQDNPEYDKEIGELQITAADIQHKEGFWNLIAGTEDFYDNIKWKKKTTTGFNLADNEYSSCRVQIKAMCEMGTSKGVASDGIHASETEPLKYSLKETYFYKPMPKASSQLFSVSYMELLPHFPKLYDECSGNLSQSYFGTMKVYYYMRVIVSDSLTVVPDSKSWKCGDWCLVRSELSGKNATVQSGHFDEDGNWIPDSDEEDVDRVVTVSDEDGADAAEKQDEIREEKKSEITIGVDNVKDYVKAVASYPVIIAKIFSFLPKWCLDMVGFAFSAMIVILVIKAVRG